MEALEQFTAVAAPILRDDVDTDQIIPMPNMVAGVDAKFGDGLFARWRFDERGRPIPDFILNRPPFDHSGFLLSGANFGCGSSREHAVWALREFGVRCVIGVSFADIFAANCQRQGLLLVSLERTIIESIAAEVLASDGAQLLALDVRAQTLTLGARQFDFAIERTLRERLLAGIDEIDETLRLTDAIDRWELADRSTRPWVHRGVRGAVERGSKDR